MECQWIAQFHGQRYGISVSTLSPTSVTFQSMECRNLKEYGRQLSRPAFWKSRVLPLVLKGQIQCAVLGYILVFICEWGKMYFLIKWVDAWHLEITSVPVLFTSSLCSSVFSGFLAKMKWWQHTFFVNWFSGNIKFFQDGLYINNCSKDALKTFNLCYLH